MPYELSRFTFLGKTTTETACHKVDDDTTGKEKCPTERDRMDTVELLYVHRNRRLIRDGSPGLSRASFLLYMIDNESKD